MYAYTTCIIIIQVYYAHKHYLCVITLKIFKYQVDNNEQQSSQQVIATPPYAIIFNAKTYYISYWASFLQPYIVIHKSLCSYITLIMLKLIASTDKVRGINTTTDMKIATSPYGRCCPLKHCSDPSQQYTCKHHCLMVEISF